ncbi:unnamed protein product, partial [Meganyctiphanes norvegica]
LSSSSSLSSLSSPSTHKYYQNAIRYYSFKGKLIMNIRCPLYLAVYLRLKNEQVTGSFKARGAFNKCLILKEASKGTKITALTSSTGNHGLACALAFSTLGIDGEIVIPVNCDQEKKQKIVSCGGHIHEYGTDAAETEGYSRQLAQERGFTFISPYNDYQIIAGQGTIGAEILKDLPDVDAVFASVGGGGLICGIAAYIKTKRPQCKVIGCSPVNSKVLHESVFAGHIVEEESLDTLSDGTAGGVEPGSVTLDLATELVDKWVLVSEEEIATAVFDVLKNHKKVIEGAAGVALAGARKIAQDLQGKKVAIVMCGASISLANLNNIMKTYM